MGWVIEFCVVDRVKDPRFLGILNKIRDRTNAISRFGDECQGRPINDYRLTTTNREESDPRFSLQNPQSAVSTWSTNLNVGSTTGYGPFYE